MSADSAIESLMINRVVPTCVVVQFKLQQQFFYHYSKVWGRSDKFAIIVINN